jgi:hypothetical protein
MWLNPSVNLQKRYENHAGTLMIETAALIALCCCSSPWHPAPPGPLPGALRTHGRRSAPEARHRTTTPGMAMRKLFYSINFHR